MRSTSTCQDLASKQNCQFGAGSNQCEHHCSLHIAKVIMWCAVSSDGIVDTCFFEYKEGQTVNAEQYMTMLESSLQNELYPHQFYSLWFWQDGVQLLMQYRFPWRFSGTCFQADSFPISGTTDHLLAWYFGTRLLPLGVCQKQGVWDKYCQYWWLETSNLGVQSRNLWWNPRTCYGIHTISTAGVCWTTRRSPWRYCIQTVMVKTISLWKS
jgi:hypothetical protein